MMFNWDYANGLFHGAIMFGLWVLLVKLIKLYLRTRAERKGEQTLVCVPAEQTVVPSGGCGVAFRGKITKEEESACQRKK